jgi:folylpolyglutamate synthase
LLDRVPDSSNTRTLQKFSNIWSAEHPNTKILFAADIPQALALAKEASGDSGVDALITGSQHLVGAALFSLNCRG